jgi:anti-sigma factor RsiW
MSSFLERMRFLRDHRWAPGQMSDYLDGALAAGGVARMDRHVVECEQCRTVLASLRAMLEMLHRLPASTDRASAVQIATSVRARMSEPPG